MRSIFSFTVSRAIQTIVIGPAYYIKKKTVIVVLIALGRRKEGIGWEEAQTINDASLLRVVLAILCEQSYITE